MSDCDNCGVIFNCPKEFIEKYIELGWFQLEEGEDGQPWFLSPKLNCTMHYSRGEEPIKKRKEFYSCLRRQKNNTHG